MIEELIASPTLDELEQKARAMEAAYVRLIEIGEGVGGLGEQHPEMLEDFRIWQDSTDNDHADTVMALIAELRAARGRADEATASLDARWEHSDHTAAKYYRRMRVAEQLRERAEAERDRLKAAIEKKRAALDHLDEAHRNGELTYQFYSQMHDLIAVIEAHNDTVPLNRISDIRQEPRASEYAEALSVALNEGNDDDQG